MAHSGASAQCAFGGTNYGNVTPAGVGQVVSLPNFVWGGDQYTLTAQAGCTYIVSTCGGGWDTVLTIFDPSQQAVAFNDDAEGCGLQSLVTFTAEVSGNYTIQVNAFPCGNLNVDLPNFTVTWLSCALPGEGACEPEVAENNLSGSGSIEVQPIQPGCPITINTFDAWGDGWNGGFLSFAINGTPIGNFAAQGFGSSASLNLLPGETLTVQYTAGDWEDENSYEIVLGGEVLFADGPFPSTGLVFSYNCQNSVSAGLTPEQLIEDVFLGECLSASGITYTGNPISIGTFTNGHAIGIESGIVLTSGAAAHAVGPNGTGALSYISGGGMSPLLGTNTFDAATFTFSFVAETDQVTFKYVFASDEYPEFVCSQFNDAFGFFVSGPGYAPNTNIAIVPGGSNLPVAINSVNSGDPGFFSDNLCTSLANSAMYVDNEGGANIEYDGYTVPLTACITTEPCQEYTITITVADVFDQLFDSAVFLEAESFSAGSELQIVATVDQAEISTDQNCENSGFFVFEIGEPLDEPVTLVYDVDVSGTVQFTQTIPVSVTFQPGETIVAIPVQAITGTVGIGLSSATVTLSSADNPGLGCSCEEEVVTSTLYFCDPQIFLPVEWLGFHAKNVNDEREVLCTWITATELNNDYFTVERSSDGESWHDIGSVPGAGNSMTMLNYDFTDRSPLPGVSYYRIRQTDYNGDTDHSEIRAVTRRAEQTMSVYPNPGKGIFRLSGYEDGDLSVYDVSGRRVPFSLGFNGELRLRNAAAGTYILELVRGDGASVERVRLVHQ